MDSEPAFGYVVDTTASHYRGLLVSADAATFANATILLRHCTQAPD